MRASSVILEIIAGFFLHTVGILGFVSAPSMTAKWAVPLVFLVPALLLLWGGLALMRYRNWRKETGIVLLVAAGATALVVLTFIGIAKDERFKAMMTPEKLAFFSDYVPGSALVGAFAIGGILLIRSNRRAYGGPDEPPDPDGMQRRPGCP